MSERLILLALDADDVCSGPRHTLAETRPSNNRIQELSYFDFPPLYWIAECGARGMVFVDAPILESRPECFGCRVKAARRRPAPYGRYSTAEERTEARRRTWRESKRRKSAAA